MCCTQRCGRKRYPSQIPEKPAVAQHSHSQRYSGEGHSNTYCLTHKDIPLGIQVPLVGQAASHDVKAVVVAGLHWHQPSAVRAVHHFQQCSRTLRRGVHLYERKRQKDKKISPQSLKQKTPHVYPKVHGTELSRRDAAGSAVTVWLLLMWSRDLWNRWRGLAHLLGCICHLRGHRQPPSLQNIICTMQYTLYVVGPLPELQGQAPQGDRQHSSSGRTVKYTQVKRCHKMLHPLSPAANTCWRG